MSVDWFMGIARALGNLIGNCVATVAVGAWNGDVDREQAHAVLNGERPVDLTPVPMADDEEPAGSPGFQTPGQRPA
ncbi:C4-dicarboxylate transport protein [compost metagenome]